MPNTEYIVHNGLWSLALPWLSPPWLFLMPTVRNWENLKFGFSDSKTSALVALYYGPFREKQTNKQKKRQTKFQQHHYLQTATNIHHQNMEGGKARALTSPNFVKAKLFPFLYGHTHWAAGLESAAGRSSAVSTQRECGSFENIKQRATKPKCHLAFGFRARGSKSLFLSLSLSHSFFSLSLSHRQTDTHIRHAHTVLPVLPILSSCLHPRQCPPAGIDNLLRISS